MSQPQTYGSEPATQPPPPAPMPAPVAPAYPPPRKIDVSKPSLVIAVIALALALVGMVAFPGPTGPEGPEGVQGPEGPAGSDGADGDDGEDGTDGADGIACWDLNGNGMPDLATEDINGDFTVDVNDCTGPQGPPGETINHSALMWGVASPKECTGTYVTNVIVWVVNLGDQTALNVVANVYVVETTSGDSAVEQWLLFDVNPHAYGYFEVQVTSSFTCSSVDGSWVTFTWD